MTRRSIAYEYDKAFCHFAVRALNDSGFRTSVKKRDIYKVRRWAVKRARRSNANITELARVLGVTRQTIYNWIARFLEGGHAALKPQSKRPHKTHKTSQEVENYVLETRKITGYGCEKLGYAIQVASTTVYRILRRNDVIKPMKKKKRKWRFFQRKHANSLWQMDLKNLSGNWWSISILDDHSRFIVGFRILSHVPTAGNVIELTEQSIAEYGKPREILTDHGAQFYANRGGISRFDVQCVKENIMHILAGVKKPTTIGKVERWHRTLEDEFLPNLTWGDENSLNEQAEKYVWHYNYDRPHFAYETFTFAGMQKRRKVIFIPYMRFVNHRRTQKVRLLCKKPWQGMSVKHVMV